MRLSPAINIVCPHEQSACVLTHLLRLSPTIIIVCPHAHIACVLTHLMRLSPTIKLFSLSCVLTHIVHVSSCTLCVYHQHTITSILTHNIVRTHAYLPKVGVFSLCKNACVLTHKGACVLTHLLRLSPTSVCVRTHAHVA